MTDTSLFRKAIWTIGAFGGSFTLKLLSTVILSRILAPDVFGIMVVINSIRFGIELLTDVGVEQNIVQHERGLDPTFFNTAWTIQIIRGFGLSLVFLALTPVLSSFYHIDARVFATVSFLPLLNSLSSTSIFVLVKNLEVRKRNQFELLCEMLNLLFSIGLALLVPSVWSLVFAALASTATRSALSYRIAHPRHRLMLDPTDSKTILRFGKWIAVTSLVVYAATNADKIYLGKIIPLTLLGVYGIARTIAELPATLAGRLGYQIVFPILAGSNHPEASSKLDELRAIRIRFVLVAALALATLFSWSDVAIRIMYDVRYRQAGWMLCALVPGAWFAVLANLSEAIALGLGRPSFNSLANVSRLVTLGIALPTGFYFFGLAGAIFAIVLSDFVRYTVVMLSQRRLSISVQRQDVLATAAAVLTVAVWTLARHFLGLGMPWASV